MQLNYYQPSAACRKLVIHYEEVQAKDESIAVIDRHIPSGYASLVFNSSGYAIVHEKPLICLPNYFMVVPLFRSVNIGIYGELDSFIITCKASILSRLLKINLFSSKNDYYRVIQDNETLNLISKKIITLQNVSQRIDLIDTYFKEIGLDQYQSDEIDLLYNKIIEGKGCTPIAEQIELSDKSARYFRQHFIKRTGVNAKTLGRIVRVNYLWSMIIKNSAVDFQDMVFEGNYFDQAHLIHDFKKIVGETPSFFFKRNHDNLKLISGKI